VTTVDKGELPEGELSDMYGEYGLLTTLATLAPSRATVAGARSLLAMGAGPTASNSSGAVVVGLNSAAGRATPPARPALHPNMLKAVEAREAMLKGIADNGATKRQSSRVEASVSPPAKRGGGGRGRGRGGGATGAARQSARLAAEGKENASDHGNDEGN
jgi:hypothetical protein